MARLRAETIQLFRDEFTREFVKRGPYKFADEPAPDVLLVVPAIEELDIKTPEAGMEPGNRTYLPGRPVTMKVTGDLRDAVTGKVVGRVITYHLPEQNPNSELRIANRTGECPGAAAGVRGMVAARARGTQRGEGGEAPDTATLRGRAAVTRLGWRLDEVTLRAQHLEISAGPGQFDERHDGERRRVLREALLRRFEPQRMHLFADIGRDDFAGHLRTQHRHGAG